MTVAIAHVEELLFRDRQDLGLVGSEYRADFAIGHYCHIGLSVRFVSKSWLLRLRIEIKAFGMVALIDR